MKPIKFTYSLDAADADGIAAAQAVAGAGNLTLNGALATGGVATLDNARHVQAVSANAGDTSQTLTFTGTDRFGNTITEVLTLNGTTPVVGKKNFKTVTEVAVSAATAGNISAGSADEAETQWVPVNRYADYHRFVCRLTSGAGLTYGLQFTLDGLQADGFQENDAVAVDHATLTGKTADDDDTLEGPATAFRIAITGHTSGGVTFQYTQASPR